MSKTIFVTGDDAIAAVEAKARELLEQADTSRELGTSLAIDGAAA
jgi:hypothetical protein